MGFQYIDLGSGLPNLIAIKVKGVLTGEDMSGLVKRLQVLLDQGEKARVYFDLLDYAGVELSMVNEKLSHMGTLWRSIDRMAYVVDREWMTKVMPLIDAVTPMHIRAFGPDQAAEAKAWLLAQDEMDEIV